MKPQRIRPIFYLLLVVALSACSSQLVQDKDRTGWETYPSQFIAGDMYILENHKKIDGNIAGIGTTLIIEDGATVLGDISLVGSNLEVVGRVAGDINVIAGTSSIRNSAIITGSINQVFHQLTIEPNALIGGEINTYSFPTPAGGEIGENVINILEWLKPSRLIALQTGRVIAMGLLALLVIFLFKNPTLRAGSAIIRNTAAAWGAGFISTIAAPFISVILILTICLSPIGILLLVVFLISIAWGWVVLSAILGKKIINWLKLEWADEPATVTGAVVLGTLTALISIIPCIGFLINLMVSAIGLGGILLSKFGTSSD